jgi:glycosyltransferase involved in cell wall biosynthesis
MVNPNKVFEYMACGLPLVASDLPSLRYIMQQSEAGLTAKADDSAAHAAAIRRLLDDPALARQLGENGRRFVYATHNWEREGEKLIQFYKGLNVSGERDADHGR